MEQSPLYLGNYLGIIIKTNDPDGRGRVKVFVPHISATVYQKWNAKAEDKVFNFTGSNLSPDLMQIKEDLEKILPWAEVAAPLIGGGSQGRFAGPNACQDASQQPPTGPRGMGVKGANFMNGQYGPPGSNLVTIKSPSGVPFTVNAAAAPNFQAFLNAAEGQGYMINSNISGGYNYRYIAGSDRLSQHAYGNAIDINQTDRNIVQGGYPSYLDSLAQEYGIIPGSQFSNPDSGHFEWSGQPLSEQQILDSTTTAPQQAAMTMVSNPETNGCQKPNTGTVADGNFKNPPIDQSGSGGGENSAVFGTNMDGTPDTTDNAFFAAHPNLGNSHIGSGGVNLLDPNLVGVALSPSQSEYFFNMSPAEAARTQQQIQVFNPATGQTVWATVSDTRNESGLNFVEGTPPVFRAVGANPGDQLVYVDKAGNQVDPNSLTEKPAALVEASKPHDGFNDTKENPILRANSHTHEYAAPSYSNVAKGVFSTPNVGAHVWCFFQEGDPLKPIIWAMAFNDSDHDSVRRSSSLQANDKRLSSENPNDNPDVQGSTDRYRGIYVHNERGGTFEIVNTEGIESMSLIGYHGNNIRLGEHLSMYAANNDQKLVAGDQFLTVNSDRNVVVRNHYDLNVYGDITRKIGHLNKYDQIYKQIIDKIKPTHDDIARFEIKRSDKGTRGSQGQSKAGTAAPCPVCAPGEKYKVRITLPDIFSLNDMVESETLDEGETSPTLIKGESKVIEAPFGTFGQIFASECIACGGKGLSPSSEHGHWQPDSTKQRAAQKMVEQIPELADLEAQLEPGGSEILQIAKDWTVSVGIHMNDMEAVRTDPKGKMLPNGIKIAKKGVYREQSEVPIMEIVPPHPAFPGGNFDFTVMNRYNVMTGSGGIFFKTKGVVQLAGTVMNLNGDQVLVTSVNEIRLAGGKSVNIEAENIRLAPDGAAQALIDGGLAVARNAIIAGGLHVEGEVSLHHITAPVEYQLTELEEPGGTTVPGKIIGHVVIDGNDTNVYGGSVDGDADPDCINVDAHRHYFKNIPLTLMETSNDVREKSVDKNKSDLFIAEKKYTNGNTKYS